MPSTLIVWPEAGIPMNSCCREPVTTHRVATVSPLAMMSCRSSFRSGEDRLEARDLLLEAGQRRLMVGRWIVVDQARVAELVDRRLVGRAKRVLEARDDLDVAGQGRPLFPLVPMVRLRERNRI